MLLLLAFVWSADVGAYFVGRRFGRRRLASRLSPGKSWEGVLGGAAASLGVGIGAALIVQDPRIPWWTFAVLAVGVALVSVLGDLTESLVKRQAGVKDSGVLIPGHGGVLESDRQSVCRGAVFRPGDRGHVGDQVPAMSVGAGLANMTCARRDEATPASRQSTTRRGPSSVPCPPLSRYLGARATTAGETCGLAVGCGPPPGGRAAHPVDAGRRN